MGRANIRLNPEVKSAVIRILLEQGLLLLFSIAMLFPAAVEFPCKRGPKPYDYRVVMVLCILRILLRKTYEDYEVEMRTDPRICKVLGLEILPGKSTIQRETEVLAMSFLRAFNQKLIEQWLKEKVDLLLDLSGIRIKGRSIWFSIRTKQRISRRECDKVHLAICENFLLVANWFITSGKRNDSPFLRRLLRPFRKLGLVIADAGYCARKNIQYIVDKGGAPFIWLKKNVTARAKGYSAWKAMVNLWKKLPLLTKGIYNKRSKIEAVFHALKERYRYKLHNKKWHTRRKEFAMRLIAYNLRIIIFAAYARKHNLPLWVRA